MLRYLYFLCSQRPLPSLTSTAPPGIIGQESSLRWKVLSAQIGEHKTKVSADSCNVNIFNYETLISVCIYIRVKVSSYSQ